tara:strand:- start:355 stop:615 length:261 start_codon:yes stop_codon:yes gene_type:complete
VAVKKHKTSSSDDVPFEEGLKKLETIVEQMEGDEMPLEDLLKHYEEGIRLAKVCQEKLEAAELKIKKLQPNADGEDELVDDDSVEF